MYLLDTDIVSQLRKPKPHGAVRQWMLYAADVDLHVSAVTIGEIQAGIKLTREQDEPNAAPNSNNGSNSSPGSGARR